MSARRAAIASVATAVLLGSLKAYAAARTGSVAVLASLADSVLDFVASLVTLGGVHWAAQPADDDHRFGHGKAEALAALFQVVVIAISAFAILLRAIQRVMAHEASTDAGTGIIVSIIAIVVTLVLTRYQRQVIRASGSVAASWIEADQALSKKDFLMRVKICRKAAKESRLFLRLIEVDSNSVDRRGAIAAEARELTLIFSGIISKSTGS